MTRVDIRSIRRRQILDAAERLAAQKGWIETTIADICQAADVSTGVVTRHFQNKDEIMLAALDDILEQLQGPLKLASNSENSLSEDIHRHLKLFNQYMASQPTHLQLLLHFIAASMSRPDIAERLHKFFSDHRQQNTMDLKYLLNEQGIVDTDPVLFVNMLGSLIFGLILAHVSLGTEVPPDQLAFHSASMLLKYFDLPQAARE